MHQSLVASFASLGLVAACCGQAVEFIPMGAPPTGDWVHVRGLSRDGTTVVGTYGGRIGYQTAFRWTVAAGFERLLAPEVTFSSGASGVNADGTVIVGTAATFGSFSTQTGFRWREGVGAEALFASGGGPGLGAAEAVSADGSTIVGTAGQLPRRWARWTDEDHVTILPPSPDGSNVTTAVAVSADGSAIGGYAASGSAAGMLWDDGVVLVLGTLGGERPNALVHAVNATGEIVAGQSRQPSGLTGGFLWTAQAGMHVFGTLPGDTGGSLQDLSADGRTVVGSSEVASPRTSRATLYTEGLGLVCLQDWLHTQFGLDLPGWTLTQAVGVSDDGLTIVGEDVSGKGWMIRLPAARPADFNLDRFVDFLDLADFLDCFEGNSVLPVSSADLNHDGFTDFFDLIEFLDEF